MQARLDKTAGKIYAPYNKWAIQFFRGNGGRYCAADRSWTFQPEIVEYLFRELYGTSDKIVTADVDYDAAAEFGNVWHIAGYILATRPYRDSRVHLGDGVDVTRGYFPGTGGSIQTPRVAASYDILFRLEVREDFANAHNLPVHSA